MTLIEMIILGIVMALLSLASEFLHRVLALPRWVTIQISWISFYIIFLIVNKLVNKKTNSRKEK